MFCKLMIVVDEEMFLDNDPVVYNSKTRTFGPPAMQSLKYDWTNFSYYDDGYFSKSMWNNWAPKGVENTYDNNDLHFKGEYSVLSLKSSFHIKLNDFVNETEILYDNLENVSSILCILTNSNNMFSSYKVIKCSILLGAIKFEKLDGFVSELYDTMLFYVYSSNVNVISNLKLTKFSSYFLDKPNFLILLTGQSNSLGWGGSSDKTNENDKQHERISGWNISTSTWDIADLDDNSLGMKPIGNQCLAFHFAKCIVKIHKNAHVGIIVVGEGGQSINRWTLRFQGDIYTQSIYHCTKAIEKSITNKLSCILWHQGESDDDKNNIYYEKYLREVIQQYRISECCKSDTPFICGDLGGKSFYWWDANKQTNALRIMNADADKNTRCANLSDLDMNDDNVHFSTESHRKMGRLYFNEFRKISNNQLKYSL